MSDNPAQPTGLINSAPAQNVSGQEKKNPLPEGVGDPPSIFVDRHHITYWKGHLRIAFAEKFREKRAWRSAILMEASDAFDLATDILDIIKELKEDEKARQTAADKAES